LCTGRAKHRIYREEANMEHKVLVAYATKYGATQEIAAKIGEVLRQEGLAAEVLAADQVAELTPYTAVILGSAVYAGQWRKEAATLLQEQEQALAERPVWLFSSGPTGEGDPMELMKGWRFPEALQPVADRIGPRDIVFFHGELDTDKLNLAEKLIVKGLRAPTGDFRDWDDISAWAASIAAALKQEVG
jgi:menaquinone-dependent protoporphyrinogen oxidase